MRHLVTLSTLAIAAAVACTNDGTPPSGPQAPSEIRAAKPVANPLPAWTVIPTAEVEGAPLESQNFFGDGGGEYISGQCGVEGQIFLSNHTGTIGGDATFENYQPRKTSCGPRSITVVLNEGVHNVPAFNVRNVLGIGVGSSRDQNFGIAVDGVTNCVRLAWWSTDEGGAGGKMTVTRTSEKTWTARTSGTAQCRYGRNNELWGATFSDVQVSLSLRQTPETSRRLYWSPAVMNVTTAGGATRRSLSTCLKKA
jgi:hypothetical protein